MNRNFSPDHSLNSNPVAQFKIWLKDAIAAKIPEPTAMALSTVNKDGQPSVRMVLLRHIDEKGFVFFTNYHSRKATEISENPNAALAIWWEKLSRQVRVEGTAEKIQSEESDLYFSTRPRGHQLSAWASEQSKAIQDYNELTARMNHFIKKFEGKRIPRPAHWGGIRIRPRSIEFWTSRPNRLHDRIRYRIQENGKWEIERLSP